MKLIGVLSLLFVGIVSYGQDITIKKKDSTVLKVKVLVSSTKELRTATNEHILFSDLVEVSFDNYIPKRDDSLIDKLVAAGVVIKNANPAPPPIKKQIQDPVYTTNQSPLYIRTDTVTVPQIVLKLEKFRRQRQTGIALQLIGAALVSGGAILKNQNGNSKPENYNPIIIGGTVVAFGGFIISFDAGRHLRFSAH